MVLIVVLVAMVEDVAMALGYPVMVTVLAIVSVTGPLIVASSLMDTARLALKTVMVSVSSSTAIKVDEGVGAATREMGALLPT